MEDNYPRFQAMNVEVVAISMDDAKDAAGMAEFVGADFPILPDPEGTVVRQYGVYDLLGDGVAAPSIFMLDKQGAIFWQHIGESISDRPTAVAVLKTLQRELQ